MIYGIIIGIIWFIGIFVSYFLVMKNWDNSTFEKIWFSVVWPVLIPLYGIHYLHNKVF